jgi:RNA polymerase sigma-70 factor (ECF subfamily)
MDSTLAAVPVAPHRAETSAKARGRRRPDRAERRLAAALRRRTPEALERVYAEYGGATFGFLLRAVGDRASAEDIQQVVFTEVWQRAAEYDPRRASLLTCILTIARSRAIDHLRKRVPEPRDPAQAVRLAEAAPRRDDPIDELLGEARLGWLLRRLPAEEAEVLRLRFRDDRSQTEIATALGLPLGTVKMRMVKALQRLEVLVTAEEGRA